MASQLRLNEAKRFLDAAFSYYERKRHPLAIGAAVALFMGLRTSEILDRQVRDVEAEGSYLCIASGKTHNAARRPEVPERIRPYLLDLSQGKRAENLLFSTRSDGKPVRRQLLHAMVRPRTRFSPSLMPRCGSSCWRSWPRLEVKSRLVVLIDKPAVLRKILSHWGLPTTTPYKHLPRSCRLAKPLAKSNVSFDYPSGVLRFRSSWNLSEFPSSNRALGHPPAGCGCEFVGVHPMPEAALR